ncbi:neprilysin-2-like [Contarinia nasturtii]|uniref:neprilysin-2-like n=1 Tax=Contarinia nasturtii TaxID=265458 RepID=UPI0012D39CE4|nr:neprilysin-2-like [Contarinia nasturtii]
MMLQIGLTLIIYSTVYINGATISNFIPLQLSIETLENTLTDPTYEYNTNENDLKNNEPNICTTDVCVKESVLMMSSLDESVNPCDDFYDFACGNFIKNTIIREEKTIEMSFIEVQDKVDEQLRNMLAEDPQPNESNAFKLAKIFRLSCINETARNEIGITPIVEIHEKIGGWPVVKGDWDSKSWEWMEANKILSNAGLSDSFIFQFYITIDSKDSSKRVIAVSQPSFGISQKFLLRGMEDTNVKAYYDFMVDVAVIFGANKRNAEIELLDALQFEIELAKISLPAEELRNRSALYNPHSIHQLQLSYPYINWLDYINWNLYGELHVDETEIVIILDTKYVSQVNAVLELTPKRTIANYFAWKSVLNEAKLLNNALHQRRQEYLAKTSGMLKADPRDTECLKLTMSHLPISVAALYVRRYADEESKKSVIDMYKNIHAEFIKTLNKVEWMDDVSRMMAIKKANQMQYHISYPAELIDDTKLEQYYQGLELKPDSFFHNVLRIRNFSTKLAINKLRKSVNKTDWETHSMSFLVNGFYSPPENSIQLPAAVLQDRFFSADRPSYMNYATIGWFIAHEITHGFDDEGRQFDINGNVANWWDFETERKFSSKAQCIIDQYSSYIHPELNLKVNGIITQGENIADNGAVKGMYAAYQKFVQNNGPEPILPTRSNYTSNQLFWISAAQLWCAVSRPEFDRIQYTTDEHAPNRYRIIGTFSNMEDFSRDFHCAPQTNMNPANKCEIW